MDKNSIPRAPSAGLIALVLLALGVLWFSGMPWFLEGARMLIASGPQPGSYRLATLGNTLLAVSAALYVADVLLSLKQLGKWASRLAAAGALVLAVNAGSHLLGLGRLSVATELSFLDIYDGFSMAVPMLVACYLLVEYANRNHNSGAFVMPLIVCLIGVEMWLLSEGASSREALLQGFREYWGHAYLVAHLIGYGSFVIAAGVGILFLLRTHLESSGRRLPPALQWLPDGWKAQSWMLSAVAAGVPVFALALFFIAGWGLGASTLSPYAKYKGMWVASVLAFYGAFLYALYSRSMSPQRMAWWTVTGLGLTLALFLGTQAFSLAATLIATA